MNKEEEAASEEEPKSDEESAVTNEDSQTGVASLFVCLATKNGRSNSGIVQPNYARVR